jgi:hypothetical protein
LVLIGFDVFGCVLGTADCKPFELEGAGEDEAEEAVACGVAVVPEAAAPSKELLVLIGVAGVSVGKSVCGSGAGANVAVSVVDLSPDVLLEAGWLAEARRPLAELTGRRSTKPKANARTITRGAPTSTLCVLCVFGRLFKARLLK